MSRDFKIKDKSVRERFIKCLKKGATYKIACGYAGIHYQTFRRYMLQAEKLMDQNDPLVDELSKLYCEFYDEVKIAEAEALMKWLDVIEDASAMHWQAAAWKIERRYFKEYGAKAADIDFNERLEQLENKEIEE